MITAKVTFGNINASDHPVENVTTTTVSPNRLKQQQQKQRNPTRESSIEANLNNHNRSSGSETSLLSENSDVTGAAAVSQHTNCVVDESVFKIPANYRCINYYADVPLPASSTSSTAAASSRPIPASDYHRYHRITNPNVDEDDLLLQLAIQRSLSEGSQDAEGGGDGGGDEENLTAMEVLAGGNNRQGGKNIDILPFNSFNSN